MKYSYVIIACLLMIQYLNLHSMEEGAGEARSVETNKLVLTRNLQYAVNKGEKERIKELIIAGANPNVTRDNPLIYAMQHNDLDLINFLLLHGARFEQETDYEIWPTVFFYLVNPNKPLNLETKNFVMQLYRTHQSGSKEYAPSQKTGHEGGM